MEWGLIIVIAFTLVVIVIVLSRAQRAVQRVMPSYFYVLLRLYMRVDDVMMRIYEYARSPHVLLLLLCVVHRCGAH
jgi:Na+/H+ antiporter NhaD/arsenite permease-like protein